MKIRLIENGFGEFVIEQEEAVTGGLPGETKWVWIGVAGTESEGRSIFDTLLKADAIKAQRARVVRLLLEADVS